MEQVEIKRNWKPLKGYEGIYDISDYGLIYSHPRKGTKGGYSYGKPNKENYLTMVFSKNGIETRKRINILVYETFVGEVPNGYEIHHINHNRQDNRLENLCALLSSEHSKEHIEEKSKKVLQYTLDGKFIDEYISTREAERKTKIPNQHIGQCCLGKRKTAGGYVWKYKGEE